jgi:hypothetical protein
MEAEVLILQRTKRELDAEFPELPAKLVQAASPVQQTTDRMRAKETTNFMKAEAR